MLAEPVVLRRHVFAMHRRHDAGGIASMLRGRLK